MHSIHKSATLWLNVRNLHDTMHPCNYKIMKSTKGCIKQRMVQNAFRVAQKSPRYSSQNHPQGAYFGPWRVKRSHPNWTVTLENGPSPSALRSTVATVGGKRGGGLPPLLVMKKAMSLCWAM